MREDGNDMAVVLGKEKRGGRGKGGGYAYYLLGRERVC